MSVGRRIEGLLAALGWTQEALALKSNVGRDRLSVIISDRSPPRTAEAIRLARSLDVSKGWLLGEDEAGVGIDADPLFLRLKAKLEELPADKRREVLAIFVQSLVIVPDHSKLT